MFDNRAECQKNSESPELSPPRRNPTRRHPNGPRPGGKMRNWGTSPCGRCRAAYVDVEFPDGRESCFDCLTFAERVEILADTYRGRYGPPKNLRCRFCGEPAGHIVALSDGCVCYPDDRVQALCCQHADRSSPLGESAVVL